MNRLKKIREEKNITQTQLASDVGVSARHIAFIENCDRNPSIDLALKISERLNTSVDNIFLKEKCTKSTSIERK